MTTTTKQLIKISVVVGLVVLVGVLLTMRPVGTTFANSAGTNGFNLTIDSYSMYNGQFREDLTWELKDLVPGVDRFFNFADIKPGDTGVNTISIHIDKNPAYACLDFTNLVDEENGTNEPESLVDMTSGGELSSAIEFFAWRDDGDNTFEIGERALFGISSQSAVTVLNDTSYPLADATTAEVFAAGETQYIGITWCAGDLAVDLDTAEVTCDATAMGNAYQTDSFTVDVSLRAVEATSFANYRCENPKVDLYLNKQISGVTQGFAPADFSYRIVGEEIDVVAPHDSFTSLPAGVYTIEELVPDGFVKEDWRIGWYGQCLKGDDFTTTIEIEERHLNWGTLYCEADNQYRPDSNQTANNGHGNDADRNDDSNPGASNDAEEATDDDGLPPGQQATDGPRGRQSQIWSRVEPPSRIFGSERFSRTR